MDDTATRKLPPIGAPVQYCVRWSPGHESTYAAIVTGLTDGRLDVAYYERLAGWSDAPRLLRSIPDSATCGAWWRELPA